MSCNARCIRQGYVKRENKWHQWKCRLHKDCSADKEHANKASFKKNNNNNYSSRQIVKRTHQQNKINPSCNPSENPDKVK